MKRKLMYVLLRPLVRERQYENPDAVGYQSWLEIGGRCVGFRKLSGQLLFSW